MSSARLRIESVGGLGEMGHHHMVVDVGEDSFLVDCGMLFAPASDPGVDRILPSFEPALQRAAEGRLRGLLLTHGHLDHLGAVPDLLAALPGLPVYATSWALALLRRRLDRRDVAIRAPLEARLVTPGEAVRIGETDATWIRVTHSLPEACSLALRGDAGTVVHSGDFRIQEDPLLGPPTDLSGLRAIGDGGVDLALVDSTSSAKPGRTLPEREVARRLTEVARDAEGAVIVTSFSSHVERMYACLLAARATGRRLAIYGRSAEETARLAIERGLLPVEAGELLPIDLLEDQPKDKLLALVTGSQGEFRAPLARIARQEDSRLSLGPGDLVVWSARVIPGGERTVGGLLNRFVEAGVRVIPPWGPDAVGLHTSGHGQAGEVAEWLDCVRPRRVLPIHGEPWHLVRHASVLRSRFAAEQVLSLRSGQVLELDTAADTLEVSDAPHGQTWIALGGTAFPQGDRALSTRRKAGTFGAATVTVPWHAGKVAGRPVVQCLGLVPLEETPALERSLGDAIWQRLAEAPPETDDAVATEKARLLLRSELRKVVRTKPPCIAALLPLDGVVSCADTVVQLEPGPQDGADRDPPPPREDPP